MSKKSRWAWLLAVLALFSLVAAACGDDNGSNSSDTTDASSVSGEVNISGSSTVEPISTKVAETLADQNPDIQVNVDGPGTGDGFKLFCAGETDISDASRQIKEEEAQACADAGIEYVEIPIAFDGLTVMTNPNNDTVECLNLADLYALMGPESENVKNWSDAQALATELGSSTTFPDASLDIAAPGAESGTYDSFIELALSETLKTRLADGKIEASADDPEAPAESIRKFPGQADDNVIISQIEGSDSSFGWVGFAFAQGAADKVKELQVDGGDGCVAPSAETIADASYPLSRTLYLYVNTAAAEENPAVAAYVDYYLSDGIGAVSDVGYVPLPDSQLADSVTAWEARATSETSTTTG